MAGSMHRITIRYIDKYGASVIPDQSMRMLKLPFKLKVAGDKWLGLTYDSGQTCFVSKYKPTANPLREVKAAKYIGVTFQPTTVPIVNGSQMDPFILSRTYEGKKTGRDTLRILVGNSYNKYRVLSANYPAINIRDPSIMKDRGTYYIIYTRGLISTTDFNHWHQIKWPASKEYDYLQDWAPEFVAAKNGSNYVVMSVCKKGAVKHQIAITSFNNGHIGKKWSLISGNIPSNAIDPNIQYANGKYYLFCKDERVRKIVMGTSNKLNGPYKVERLAFDSSRYGSIEGPEALIENNKIRLTFDTYNTETNGVTIFHGLHYVERNIIGGKWSKMKRIQSPIVTRHGQFILNR